MNDKSHARALFCILSSIDPSSVACWAATHLSLSLSRRVFQLGGVEEARRADSGQHNRGSWKWGGAVGEDSVSGMKSLSSGSVIGLIDDSVTQRTACSARKSSSGVSYSERE